MSKQIKELTGIEHYVGTGYEVIFMAEKINELVNQVNELTEAVNILKMKIAQEEMHEADERLLNSDWGEMEVHG